uniref:AP2/ERF domain-containing protein n=1 Tax=Physcomitrium patens TaxID=3218 RepID=A9RL52_PHYPA|nr:hypothetical protein PHYPA_020906 [Physcomitrium patens]
MWAPTGNRQSDGGSRIHSSRGNPTSKGHRVMDRVRVIAGSVKWSYLEMEDHLKCRFWEFFSGTKSRCSNKDCPTCYPATAEATRLSRARDGRFSSFLQKIRTWPRLGSCKIRDQAAHHAQQPQPAQSSQPERMKAASFPAKHRDLSRARYLPRRFQCIVESSIGGSKAPDSGLPNDGETPYTLPVVEVEIVGCNGEPTPSVEDLDKYSYSFGSDLSFENRDNSMVKDQSLPRDVLDPLRQNSTPTPPAGQIMSPVVADINEVPESAGPAPLAFEYPSFSHGSPLAPTTPTPAGISNIPGSFTESHGHGWHSHSQFHNRTESSIPEVCALQMENVPQSRFTGVRWKAKKWTSEIRPTGAKKTVWLGTYNTEEEAASAYDAGIFYYHKVTAYNFHDSVKYLPELNPALEEKAQLNFIKTQARLIAKKRAQIMANQSSESERACPPTEFVPRTPDTVNSRAEPANHVSTMAESSRASPLTFFNSFKRALSRDSARPNKLRREF